MNFEILVEKASVATKAVRDKNLRLIAFKSIFNYLLYSGEAVPAAEAATPKRKIAALDERLATKIKPMSKKGKGGPTSWVRELCEEGFFNSPRAVGDILEELGNRSYHLKGTSLTWQLQMLCRKKVLRRKKMKPDGSKRPVFYWSNW
jgi:hypothetical protein